MTDRLVSAVVRTSAFIRKEVVAVLRQPRLVLTLIVGPFAILALFGVGYRTENPDVRAIFVADPSSELAREIEQRITEASDDVTLVDITADADEAGRALRRGLTDIVVIAPQDPVTTVKRGEQAEFTVLHDQLDPFERATLSLIARATVDTVNRRVLEQLVRTGQAETEDVESALPLAIDSVRAMRVSLEAGDVAEARRHRREAAAELSALERELGGRTGVLASIEQQVDGAEPSADVSGELGELQRLLTDIELEDGGRPLDSEVEQVAEVEARLEEIRDVISEFRAVDAAVLVSPFGVETSTISAIDLSLNDFYAPGVIALLLQHLSITFAGLSFVKERQIGATEVFRVSPIRTAELLLGKFLGYFVFAGLVAVALSILTLYVVGTPLAGSMVDYAVVIVLLIAASLGVGFLLSTLVTSDSQAINLAMIILLVSIFFSGFFLSLERLEPVVRAVSWALPITHAIDSLRDVMFRGESIEARTWLALGGGSIALFSASIFMIRRRLTVS